MRTCSAEAFVDMLETLRGDIAFNAKIETLSLAIRSLPITGDRTALLNLLGAYETIAFTNWIGKIHPVWIFQTRTCIESAWERARVAPKYRDNLIRFAAGR